MFIRNEFPILEFDDNHYPLEHDGGVGFAYMKSFEREQRVREEARREGLSAGRSRRTKRENLTRRMCNGIQYYSLCNYM